MALVQATGSIMGLYLPSSFPSGTTPQNLCKTGCLKRLFYTSYGPYDPNDDSVDLRHAVITYTQPSPNQVIFNIACNGRFDTNPPTNYFDASVAFHCSQKITMEVTGIISSTCYCGQQPDLCYPNVDYVACGHAGVNSAFISTRAGYCSGFEQTNGFDPYKEFLDGYTLYVTRAGTPAPGIVEDGIAYQRGYGSDCIRPIYFYREYFPQDDSFYTCGGQDPLSASTIKQYAERVRACEGFSAGIYGYFGCTSCPGGPECPGCVGCSCAPNVSNLTVTITNTPCENIDALFYKGY